MAKRDPLTDDELASILAQEEASAVGFRNSELADDQQNALDYYYGEPFGDEEEGRSQVVTRDVAEVVDHMTVSVLRNFVSGDRVVEFEPKSEDQEQAADDATETVHYWFMRRQNGYRILHDWLKAGNLEKLGVVKTYCEEETATERQTFPVQAPEEVELIEAQGWTAVAQAEDGVVFEKEARKKVYRDDNIPSEEFLFSRRCRSLETADYLAHRTRKTLSDLIEMGFDRDVVMGLSTEHGTHDMDSRESNRFEGEDASADNNGIWKDPSMREVWLLEEYVKIDRNGDGIAELICVHRIDKEILSVEEVEEQPFTEFTPFPMQHKLVGQSLADKVMDIQRVRSVILRQSLDNLYMANAPRMLVNESSITENTVDDLLNVRSGAIIRYEGEPPTPLTIPFAARDSFTMLEFITGERESRTGITRLNQGLDRDALNKTATGTAMMQEQGQQIEEYVARNFAESVSRLFAKKLRLIVKHSDGQLSIKKGGTFTQVDPSSWDADMDLCINVGLGSGRKDTRIAYRQQVIAMQAQALEAQTGLVLPKHLFNSAQGFVADVGLGQASDYFLDPDSDEAKEIEAKKAEQGPAPDPEMAKVQMQGQIEQAKMQAQQQSDMGKMQLEQQKAQTDIQLRDAEASAKLDLMREEATLKAELEREKATREYELAVMKMQAEQDLARERMAMEREIASERAVFDSAAKTEAAKLSSNRAGGSLSE